MGRKGVLQPVATIVRDVTLQLFKQKAVGLGLYSLSSTGLFFVEFFYPVCGAVGRTVSHPGSCSKESVDLLPTGWPS